MFSIPKLFLTICLSQAHRVIWIIINLIKAIMQEEIAIHVSPPQQRSEIGGVNKFFAYPIKGKDAKGEIDTVRRYSDFFLLREILTRRWPGFYVPSLPEKKTIGSDDKLFVESRRRGLEYFLVGLSQNERLWQSEQVDIFLRNNSGDIDKALSPLLKESFDKLLTRYKSLFPELEAEQAKQGKLQEFNSYLRGSRPILDKLTEMTQHMHELARRSLEKRLMLIEFLLPDYEKHCLLENDEHRKADALLFLCAANNGIGQAVQKFKKLNEYPPVLLISQEIKRQRKEIEAFEEVLKGRDELQADRLKAMGKVKDLEIQATKINSGKESFFNKLKKVSKEEQLAANQKELQKAKAEEKNYAIMTRIVTNLVASREIDRFKQKRQKAYFQLLKEYAKIEKSLAEGQSDIWTQVGRHDWIGLDQQSILTQKEEKEPEYFSAKKEPQTSQVIQEKPREGEQEIKAEEQI